MGANKIFFAIKQLLAIQALAIVLICALTLLVWGWREARSALLGGLIAFLPNAYFGASVGRPRKSTDAQQLLRLFYAGEAIKIIMTGILFILAFQLPDILFIPLFSGFIAVIAVFWFALLLRNRTV
jgi:ATP synthase protein I